VVLDFGALVGAWRAMPTKIGALKEVTMKAFFFLANFLLLLAPGITLSAESDLPGYRDILWGMKFEETLPKLQEMFSRRAVRVDTSDKKQPLIVVKDSLMGEKAIYTFRFSPLSRIFYEVEISCDSCENVESILTEKYGTCSDVRSDAGEKTILLWYRWDFPGLRSITFAITISERGIDKELTYTDQNGSGLAWDEKQKMESEDYKRKGKDEF
jgi:hypothetical protein